MVIGESFKGCIEQNFEMLYGGEEGDENTGE